MINPIALIVGWLMDLVFGDPERLPHPIVWFGKMIAFGEKRLNKGQHTWSAKNSQPEQGSYHAITKILGKCFEGCLTDLLCR